MANSKVDWMEQVKQLLQSLDENDSKLASSIEWVLTVLEREGLAYRVRLSPKVVGVHPKNRGGWGVSPSGSQALGDKITAMGFVLKETWHAVCIEDDTHGTSMNFTQSMFDTSDGLLGQTAVDVKYGSVSCSHTNQWLNAVLAGARSEFDNMTVGGKLSYAKLADRDPALKDALDNGLTWLVIRAKAVAMFEALPQLIQAAKNATGATHQKEDAFQTLHQLQSMAASMAATQTIDWDLIKRVVGVRTQCNVDDLNPLVAFAQKFGGGATTAFVDDLARFHKLYVPPGRIVPNTTWQALADLRITVSDLSPYVVYGVVKCQASCHKDKCDGHVCKYISASEINTLATSRKDAMLKAEKCLSECRFLAKTAATPPEVTSKALGRLDVLMVRIVLDKKLDGDDMSEITKKFMDEIGYGPPDVAKGSKPGLTTVPNFVRYDEEGRPIAGGALTLRTEGFDVGATVKRDDDLYKVAAVHDDGNVDVSDLRTGNVEHVPHDVFMSDFKKTAETFEEFTDWRQHTPDKQDTYTDAVSRAHVLAAMSSVARDAEAPEVRIIHKPAKAVIVTQAYGAKKLRLFPESFKITFDNRTAGAFKGSINKRDVYFVPAPCNESFAVPAWSVQTTEIEDDANVHLVDRKVALRIGNTVVDVHVPVIENRRGLKKGDELLLFRAPIEKVTHKTTKRTLTFKGNAAAKAKASAKP